MDRSQGSRRSNRLTASQAVNLWLAIHHRKPISASSRKKLLESSTLQRILEYPKLEVEQAIRKNGTWKEILEDLQRPYLQRPMTVEEKKTAASFRRTNPTPTEERLWNMLMNRQIDGYLFEREVDVLGWTADFFCAEASLVIEVDGKVHRRSVEKDSQRDQVMRANGYKVLRIESRHVMQDPETVVAWIRQQLPDRPSSKAARTPKTSQSTPKRKRQSASTTRAPSSTSKPKKSTRSRAGADLAVTKSFVTKTIEHKGPVRCPECKKEFIGTYQLDKGWGHCHKCRKPPVALCRHCRKPIPGSRGRFVCKTCDTSFRSVAIEAAGRGAQHPTNTLRQARRGRRI